MKFFLFFVTFYLFTNSIYSQCSCETLKMQIVKEFYGTISSEDLTVDDDFARRKYIFLYKDYSANKFYTLNNIRSANVLFTDFKYPDTADSEQRITFLEEFTNNYNKRSNDYTLYFTIENQPTKILKVIMNNHSSTQILNIVIVNTLGENSITDYIYGCSPYSTSDSY